MSLNFFDDESTICAQATPAGRSGVAVVRLSGKDSFSVLSKIAPKLTKKPESHRIYLTKLYEIESGDKIDEVLISYFGHGKSYTGEQSLEISSHGNPVIVSRILNELVQAGARMAGPGEFTYRAFTNAKIDLVQAESVLNLIEANSARSAKLSLKQLEGELSTEIGGIEDKLVYLLANFEASIDFTEEDIEIVDYTASSEMCAKLLKRVEELINSYKSGKLIKDGLQVALVGAPNAGKSSLLNALLKQDKAIVSDMPGTTRDVIEATIQMDGLSIHLYDTAGIRDTSDKIEKLGIQKSEQAIDEADHVICLVDPTEDNLDGVRAFVDKLPSKNSTLAISKTDLVSCKNIESVKKELMDLDIESLQGVQSPKDLQEGALLLCSSVSEKGLESIRALLKFLVGQYHFEDTGVIQQARHFELLGQVHESLAKGLELINNRDSVDFISFELHNAIHKLHEVLGKRFDDEVMDRVFKEFCIGK